MSDRVLVVAAVILRGGRLLVSQRGEGSGYAGCWEFPGGKVEEGEDECAALRRELREELGIDAEVGARVWTSRSGPLILRFRRCDYPQAARPRPLQCAQFRWVRLDEIASYRFPPADDGLIAAIRSGRIPGLGR